MSRKIITKMTAITLAFILTFANVIVLGTYVNETIAASISLEEQTKEVANASIEFDAYFEEEGQAVHSKEINMLTGKDKIYLSLK